MSQELLEKRHYRVTGHVQGVAYRYTTQQTAIRLGLTGWVKNNSDGSVELLAEGTTNSLDTFGEWLQQGPTLARVDQVLLLETEILNDIDISTFEIRREI